MCNFAPEQCSAMQTSMHSHDIIPKIAPEQCSATQTAMHSDDNIPKFLLRSSALHCTATHTATVRNELYYTVIY